MRISDWSSDVCSSDLNPADLGFAFDPLEPAAGGVNSIEERRLDGFALVQGKSARLTWEEIGRASCRERVCQRVDLGGRRIIKKKTKHRPRHASSNTNTQGKRSARKRHKLDKRK